MKGKKVYIHSKYIIGVRKSLRLPPRMQHEIDLHNGQHLVIGEHDGELELAPICGTAQVLRVPAYAVWPA